MFTFATTHAHSTHGSTLTHLRLHAHAPSPPRTDNAGAAGGETLGLDEAAEQLRSAVLDLTGEDQDAMKAAQRQYQWDRRKKRYVQRAGGAAGAGERGGSASGAARNESGKGIGGGKKAEAKKGELYKKWARQNKARVSSAGAEEDGGRVAAELAKRFSPANRHKSWRDALGVAAGGVAKKGGELRPKAQVRTGAGAAGRGGRGPAGGGRRRRWGGMVLNRPGCLT